MSIVDLPMNRSESPDGPNSLGRTPPQDLAAEQSVLGGMMLSKDAIADVVEVLRSVDFYRPAHELVYDCVLDLYGRGEPADAVTVADELTKRGKLSSIGGLAYLHTLISSVPTAANAGFYARIVRERAVLRRLVEAGTRIVQLGYGGADGRGGGDVDDIVNTAQSEVFAVTETRTSEDYAPLADVIESTIDEIEASSHRGDGLTGVPTGFADLDRLTNGFHPGQMIVIAARPAMGKALALDTPLPTPTGWTAMGRVRVGDQLVGADGRPTRVVAATGVLTGRPCYRVTFCDGSSIVADALHQWLTRDGDGPATVRTTEQLLDRPGRHRVTNTEPLEGRPRTARDDRRPGLADRRAGEPYALGVRAGRWSLLDATDRVAARATLRGPLADRREVLAGLLDSVGAVTASGAVTCLLPDGEPADWARELVAGLGHTCSRDGDGTLRFVTEEPVFADESLALLHKERMHRRGAGGGAPAQRRIVAVEPVPGVPVRCVEVSAADHLFLAGRSMVPTHNSTLGLDIARSASIHHQMTSVMFSLEMGRNEITMRLLSAEARIPLQNMRKGTMREEDWTRLARTMGDVSEAPFFIDDSPNMSLMEIRAKCRRLKQRNDLRLVIIDYLQLMTSGKRVESRQQEVSEFSRALKLLAKELHVPVIALSQLNRGPEQRTDKKPQMADLRESGCLTAETRLLRADTGAEVTLGELHASGATDVPVWSLDDSLRYVRRHLTHVFSTGVKPVFRLTLASGKEIRATANHPFLAYAGWTPLRDLRPGTRVAVPRHVPAPTSIAACHDQELILLAHLIGDGSFVARQSIRYASVDEENLAAVDLAARHFGVTAVRDEYAAARCSTLRLPAPYRPTHGRRNPIASWLDDLGLFGLRSHEKFVPDAVFRAPKRQIALFLRHLWATDGSVTVARGSRGGRVYYASTSRRLVDDVARLLLRFGISGRIRTVRKTGYRDGFTLDISGADSQRRFLREIGVHGTRSRSTAELSMVLEGVRSNTNVDTVPLPVWDKVRELLAESGTSHRQFAQAMGTAFSGSTLWKRAPSRHRLGRVAALLEDSQLAMEAVNDVFWDTVSSVEPDGVEAVYDATVVGTHNFVANGIAAHNSIEQDADMVILLHREDAYEKESPRAGEADFIVAKHRNGPTDTITVAFQGHYSRFVDMAT